MVYFVSNFKDWLDNRWAIGDGYTLCNAQMENEEILLTLAK